MKGHCAGLEVYLVGGAVRDTCLGLPVAERDWVVVGATGEKLERRGFRPVGRDFPVYLHPETGEEYALARTERKTAPGYRGFAVHAAPDVTLADDLHRRDLTINALAQTADGTIIDPWGGLRDLDARILRHVSPAFGEDPVRVLRVARFAARLAPLGFRVADDTLELMRAMSHSGEVDALVAERVWAELGKALASPSPDVFIRVLREADALVHLFPEIDALFGVPQRADYHPEIDTGEHLLLVLQQASRLSRDPLVHFAALTHDLGKALTPKSGWPRHHGHETLGLPALASLCTRLRVPRRFQSLAEKVMRHHGLCHQARVLRPATLVDLFYDLDAWRAPETLERFLAACEADARGRTGLQDGHYPAFAWFRDAFAAANTAPVQPLLERGLTGQRLGAALREARVRAVATWREAQPPEAPAA